MRNIIICKGANDQAGSLISLKCNFPLTIIPERDYLLPNKMRENLKDYDVNKIALALICYNTHMDIEFSGLYAISDLEGAVQDTMNLNSEFLPNWIERLKEGLHKISHRLGRYNFAVHYGKLMARLQNKDNLWVESQTSDSEFEMVKHRATKVKKYRRKSERQALLDLGRNPDYQTPNVRRYEPYRCNNRSTGPAVSSCDESVVNDSITDHNIDMNAIEFNPVASTSTSRMTYPSKGVTFMDEIAESTDEEKVRIRAKAQRFRGEDLIGHSDDSDSGQDEDATGDLV